MWPCSPGAPECKTLQSVSFRRDHAGRNRRHSYGIGAIKLEAAPRHHLQRFCTTMHRIATSNDPLSGLPNVTEPVVFVSLPLSPVDHSSGLSGLGLTSAKAVVQ